MILPKFDYFAPQSLSEAVKWLAEHDPAGVRVLAGGTDLLVDIRGKIIPDSHQPRCQQHTSRPGQVRDSGRDVLKMLVSLSRIKALRHITADGHTIRIGAMSTITDLERSTVLGARLSALADGASQLGSPLVRNRGTYGGNLCNARPAGDTAIPTLALGGVLKLVSADGERLIDHEQFVTGPGQTIIEPGEILTEVRFETRVWPEPSRIGSAYIKLANRKALEISVVGAAAYLCLGLDDKVIDCRIALGAVAPTPLLVPEAASVLIGHKFSMALVNQTAQQAARIAKPITDHRGSREYRKMMIEVLVRRALLMSYQRCQKSAGEGSA